MKPLSDLPQGRAAIIAAVDPAAPGLADLGLVPGARIVPAYSGLGGDPRVYRVDGALVAMRREAARWILVTPALQTAGGGD